MLFPLSSFSQSLVAYYPFNGNANDISGNANNGTVNGATLTIDRFGNANSAYYFDGVSNYISIADNPNINIQTVQSYSISFWCKHDAQNNATYLISKYKGSFGEPSYAIGTGSAGDSYSWFEFTASNGIENRGAIDLNDTNWHNITTVFKSGVSVSIYVDGVLDISNTTTYSGSIINTRNLTIGSGSNLAQFYKGSIDNIKIYNKALTETEIKNEVNGLVAYYPFNGDANDISGNDNNGTVHGATLTTDRFGNANSAYHFNGTDNFILCNSEIGPFGTHSRTISFWAKTDVVPDANNQQNTVLSYGGDINNGGSRFEILLNPKCRGLGIDVSSSYFTKEFDNSNNGWHFYTVVYDNTISNAISDLKFYADGVLLTNVCNTNGNIDINTLNEQVLNIGRLFYTGQPRYFKGDIDDLKIYNKALTATEINNEANGLIANYPFNGNANDESGNNHNGTVHSASLTTDRFGNANSAYYFDGTNNYIDVGAWETGGAMTFNFWARWDAFNNWSRLMDFGMGQQNDNIYIGNEGTSNILMFHTLDGATKYLFYCDDPAYPNRLLQLNTWTMITCTVDNSGLMKAYKDGALIGAFNGFTPTKMVRTFQYFGRSNWSADQYFKGAIDEVRIYSMALTDAQVLSLYTNNTLAVNKVSLNTNTTFYVYHNILYFKSTQNLNELKNIEVYNLLGQKVFKTSKIEKEIPITNLQKGMYLLKVENLNGNYQTLKFIIY